MFTRWMVLQGWLEDRKEAARLIDVETCEVVGWDIEAMDPYGFEEALGELSEEQKGYYDKCNMVCSPESGGWIAEYDLPEDKWNALYARIRRREAEAA